VGDDDLDVLPDDDDLEAVLEEVAAAPEPVAAPPAPPVRSAPARPAPVQPAPARPAPVQPAPARPAPARPAPAPPAAAPVAPPAPLPVAPAAAAPDAAAAPAARRAEDDPLLDLAGAPPDDDLVGPLDVVQDAEEDAIEVAAPPAEFDGTLPSGEAELELDPGDLESLDVDLGQAGEFSTGHDGSPMIGGNEEFSEGDFAGGSEEDPNAKTQPDLAAEAAAAPAASADVSDGLFGDEGADLSVFGDDEPVER
jgi:hypothetical protein